MFAEDVVKILNDGFSLGLILELNGDQRPDEPIAENVAHHLKRDDFMSMMRIQIVVVPINVPIGVVAVAPFEIGQGEALVPLERLPHVEHEIALAMLHA